VRELLHDLRQPLAAIRLLSEGIDDDPRLRDIHRQAQWLSALVEDVLMATRDRTPVVCDVVAIVNDNIERAAPTATCTFSLDTSGPSIAFVDPATVGRAIGCVLDNAVRAAGSGGHVDLGVHGSVEGVSIVVSDDGPGLGRVAPQNSMGLTITRALLASCGGTFTLRQGSVRGAVAHITVPSASAEAVAS